MKTIRQVGKSAVRSLWASKIVKFLDTPLFIVACGRSGSTAMCRSLGEHPQLLVARSEGPLIHRIGEIAYDYSQSIERLYLSESIKLKEHEFKHTLKSVCYTSAFGSEFGIAYNPLNFRRKNSIFKINSSIMYWGSKVFPNEYSYDGLLWLYPRAKFIYLFRNGLDVVHSMSKFWSFKTLDFTERCLFWSERVAQYEYLRDHQKALCVRFEDFVTDNITVFEQIFAHLGMVSDKRPAEFASSNFVHPLDSETSPTNPRNELVKRDEAYSDWSREQKAIFKEICADAMSSLDYEIPF